MNYEKILQSLIKKFQINPTTLCWDWKAGHTSAGHPTFVINQQNYRAHRVTYELFVEKIPPHHKIIQTCNNKNCINPNHLQKLKLYHKGKSIPQTLINYIHNKYFIMDNNIKIKSLPIPHEILYENNQIIQNDYHLLNHNNNNKYHTIINNITYKKTTRNSKTIPDTIQTIVNDLTYYSKTKTPKAIQGIIVNKIPHNTIQFIKDNWKYNMPLLIFLSIHNINNLPLFNLTIPKIIKTNGPIFNFNNNNNTTTTKKSKRQINNSINKIKDDPIITPCKMWKSVSSDRNRGELIYGNQDKIKDGKRQELHES